MAATPRLAGAPACANCGARLLGPYCAECGQKEPPNDPSLHDVLHDAAHEFLHLDGKILSTLKLLVLRPGMLTLELLSGRRARYIGPIRVYLTFSVLFFLLSGVLAHSYRDRVRIRFRAPQDPAFAFLKAPADRANANPELVQHALIVNSSRISFVLVPVFAGFVRLAYRRGGRRYPACLYFSLHYFSFAFLALSVFSLGALLRSTALTALLLAAVVAACVWYLLCSLRTVYGRTRAGTALRAGAVLVLYLPCLMLGLFVAVLSTLFAV